MGQPARLGTEALTRDDDLDGQTQPEALRSWYGARPTEEFVRENWDVLRDAWLSRDTESRKLVVEQLWSLGVGEGQDYPTNKPRTGVPAFMPERSPPPRSRS